MLKVVEVNDLSCSCEPCTCWVLDCNLQPNKFALAHCIHLVLWRVVIILVTLKLNLFFLNLFYRILLVLSAMNSKYRATLAESKRLNNSGMKRPCPAAADRILYNHAIKMVYIINAFSNYSIEILIRNTTIQIFSVSVCCVIWTLW